MVGIIGGGISGVSAGKLLKEKKIRSVIYESSNQKGGLISCKISNGVLFHTTGGHVFNTKNEKVKKWFFSHFEIDNHFLKATRNAKILLDNKLINYPIENNINQLSQETGLKIIEELLKNNKINKSSFASYLETTFGTTLFKLYFEPYNKKIWQYDLNKMSLDWLEGKLPMPNKTDIIFKNLYKINETEMTHSTFFYPKKGGSQFIIDKIGKGLDIRLNERVKLIELKDGKWNINNDSYEKIIYTGNITELPNILKGIDISDFDFSDFKSHGTTTVLCEVETNDLSWLYLPEKKIKGHRVIMTGNFSENNNGKYKCTATVEFSRKISKERIYEECKKLKIVKNILDYNFTRNSYVIQNSKTRTKVKRLKEILHSNNFFLLGRFAEWEYYNMDNAINSAMKLANTLSN
jgi:protoporphyrinogen oxidase